MGPNKFIAKVASDLRKPDGLVVIPPEKVSEFVATLPVEKLWGVGPATARRLHAVGLKTALDIRRCPKELLFSCFGKFGLFLHALSLGEDNRPVKNEWGPKSRGSETTFDTDTLELGKLESTLAELAREVSESLKRHNLPGRTVVLKVKYADFSLITRSRTLGEATIDADHFNGVAKDLLKQTEAGKGPIRLLGISVTNLVTAENPDGPQLPLPF